MSGQPQTRRWAPWWAYLAVAVVLNVVRQVVFPPAEVAKTLTVLLFVLVLAVTFAVVTPAWRVLTPSPGERR